MSKRVYLRGTCYEVAQVCSDFAGAIPRVSNVPQMREQSSALMEQVAELQAASRDQATRDRDTTLVRLSDLEQAVKSTVLQVSWLAGFCHVGALDLFEP